MESIDKHTHHPLTREAWDRIGRKPHHGINVPLFSLRTENSSGIGEFLDLLPLVDWCEEIGFDVIQILPLNDTGRESSPYNAISSCGLNPIFLSLTHLPHLDDHPELQLELNGFHKFRELVRLPYEAVLHAKLAFLRLYFQKCFIFFQEDPDFQKFIELHEWLKSYALFKVLKDRHEHKNWSEWNREYINPSHTFLKKLYEDERPEMNFYFMIQYLAFQQMKQVKTYANHKKIFLKGDVPILISPESLDVWLYREEFNLDVAAGAPPDIFTEEGQNWGFPTFRWEIVEKNEFSWWRTRLKVAEELYDIYRIDHIIGFYRIWTIKRGDKPKNGNYIPYERWIALAQGERILQKLISFTGMLPIGEDLGLEIENIRFSMLGMGIPGTRIPRWERHYATDRSYIPYHEYPQLSLTTVSTHDSDTLEQWWEKYPVDSEEFCRFRGWKYDKKLSTQNRFNLLQDSHKTPSYFHINLLNEYLALFNELSWPNPDDERINLPGTIIPSNWCYRLRPTFNQILNHSELKDVMRALLKNKD